MAPLTNVYAPPMPERNNAMNRAGSIVATILATALTAFLPAAAAVSDPWEEAGVLLEKAAAARDAGNLSEVVSIYRNAAELLEQGKTHDDPVSLILRAELQRDLARAMADAGTGDPCVPLAQGQRLLQQAGGADSLSYGAQVREEIAHGTDQLSREQQRQRCASTAPPVNPGQPDSALVGHYYLSGVMETGSELRLKADGRFEWYISYGSVDQMGEGRWGASGGEVMLVADQPAADAPLFRADERFEWNEDAERRMRELAEDKAVEAAAALCPWNVAVAMSPPVLLPEGRPPANAADIAAAQKALAQAEMARDTASRAAAVAVGADPVDAVESERAADAMDAWHNAKQAMEDAYRVAGMEAPDIGAPVMPPVCTPRRVDHGVSIPQSEWQPSVAVIVGDPARELRLSRVGVVFIYSDGHRETTQTSRGGWAFAPARTGVTVSQLVLSFPKPVNRSQTLSIPSMAHGIQTVIADTRQIEAPPFTQMRLDVRDGDLFPQDMPRGRYSRN